MDSVYICQVITNKKKAILRSPAQFWKSWSEILTSYLDLMCTRTESRACFFFHPSFGQFLFFSDLYTGHISRTKNKHLLLLCIIVVSTKSLPNTLHWAGHDQSTSLAVTWQAQLVLPRSTFLYFGRRPHCPSVCSAIHLHIKTSSGAPKIIVWNWR